LLRENEKILDAFPGANIRANAIKYLFYKVKPGAYILPFLQEEDHEKPEEKPEEKPNLAKQFTNFFRKTEKVVSMEGLRGDPEFEEVSKKV
jgi:hypothetical protein